MKTNLITLLDEVFPGVNALFASAPRKSDGHEKWVDFAMKFWHWECVCDCSETAFARRYQQWCSKNGYRFSEQKATQIYAQAVSHPSTLPKTKDAKSLITYAVNQLNTITETLSSIQNEMLSLASALPEFPVVMGMFGVGETFGSQLMAEIGDIERLERKQTLVAFAGVDAPPYQSGSFESQKRHISKRGSPKLRKTLFQVMNTILQHAPADNPVFQFLDKKRTAGKPYRVYMMASANKFLRIHYATVKLHLESLEA